MVRFLGVYGESNVDTSVIPIEAPLFLSALPFVFSLSRSLHLSLPHQMHFPILSLRSRPRSSLLVPFLLWRAQVRSPYPPFLLLFPCLLLWYALFAFLFHALLSSSLCFSLMHFLSFLCPDYWNVLEEIQILSQKSSPSSHSLRYLQGRADTFGGNFTFQDRFSHFNNESHILGIPCGFLTKFPITNSG